MIMCPDQHFKLNEYFWKEHELQVWHLIAAGKHSLISVSGWLHAGPQSRHRTLHQQSALATCAPALVLPVIHSLPEWRPLSTFPFLSPIPVSWPSAICLTFRSSPSIFTWSFALGNDYILPAVNFYSMHDYGLHKTPNIFPVLLWQFSYHYFIFW